MATPSVPVNPETLRWARKTASASEEQAAKKAGVEVDRLLAWESGEDQPTVAQLRQLSDLYKRPLAFFLLDEVPKDFTVMKAFRRLPERDDLDLSFELAKHVRQALQRRDVALELGPDVDFEPRPFEPKATMAEAPAKVASRTRDLLGISLAQQRGWKDDYAAFRSWRKAVEDLGVLTFQVPRVAVEEMRGLSIFQDRFPVVLLNGGDAVRGRIFTLAHELGHLLLRTSVSKDSSATLADPDAAEEVWCNEFAGSLLVPTGSISWVPYETDPDGFDWDELRSQANQLKVSREVVLRRLLAASNLTKKDFQILRRELHSRYPVKAAKGGPVAQDVMVVSRLGIPFVRTILAAYHQGRLTLSDVSDHLDVRVNYVPQIEDRVLSGGYDADGAEA